MYPQKRRSNKTLLFILGCPILACTFLCLACFGFGVLSMIFGEDTSDSTQTIETQDDTLIVPGNGFIDGRDLEAIEPITLEQINIWNNVSRTRVVCTLKHGTPVKLDEAKYVDEEQRWYLKVSTNSCEGWVSKPFVSSQKHPAEGEIS